MMFVSVKLLRRVINTRQPRGLFLARDRPFWTAADNTTGDAWTEDFGNIQDAARWLNGEERDKIERDTKNLNEKYES